MEKNPSYISNSGLPNVENMISSSNDLKSPCPRPKPKTSDAWRSTKKKAGTLPDLHLRVDLSSGVDEVRNHGRLPIVRILQCILFVTDGARLSIICHRVDECLNDNLVPCFRWQIWCDWSKQLFLSSRPTVFGSVDGKKCNMSLINHLQLWATAFILFYCLFEIWSYRIFCRIPHFLITLYQI